jgi:hypothetical protein
MCFVASQDIDMFCFMLVIKNTKKTPLSLPAAYFVAPVVLHVHTISDLTAVGNTAVCITTQILIEYVKTGQ